MKSKKWLTLLLAALMGLSVVSFAACEVNVNVNPGNTGGTEQENPDNTGGNNNPDDGKTENPDDGKEDPPVIEDAWHNQSIWLQEDPLVPTAAVTMPKHDSNRTKEGVAVHDPSVFQDPKDGKYYAFGSHFMVASSSNLLTWKQEVGDGSSESSGQVQAKKLYNADWRTVLKESVAYAGRGMPSTWAPDVEYFNGKYYMYVSLTSSFGSNRSVISRVEADNVLGPYSNETVIIKSGEAGGPNAIDPELFFDKDGKLWMVYGSHFAGIYIKELYNEGENMGLPKEEGWGKLLWKGGSKVVEGPFVFYNASTEYYYLMTTYGDLTSDYNMHVARSKNPNGPYVDVAGDDMATTSDNGNRHGNKIAGNYLFARSSGAGYAALGHNSVIKDKNGRYFVVYHTRSQTGNDVSGGHKLMVSQLFFNEDGWPVMSPTAYVNEKAGLFEESAVAKSYEIVLHSETTTKTLVHSEDYTLNADHTITKGGSNVGTWELKDGYYIELTISGVTYKGVVVPGWDIYSNNPAATVNITAVSNAGRSLWAISK